MSTTSLPAGDTVSPSALGEPHTTTQHTVTGECVHITQGSLANLSWVVVTGGGKMNVLVMTAVLCVVRSCSAPGVWYGSVLTHT